MTIAKANELCARAGFDPVQRSGWRPATYNATVPGAAQHSTHITGEAVDIADPDGVLARWCGDHLPDLIDIGLWMEDARTTPGWVHLQIVPPKSGHRVYLPSADWYARLKSSGETA